MTHFPDEEIERVRKELQYTLQENISAWLRGRFWVSAIVIGVLSFFGVRGVVQQVFEEDLKETRKATLDIVVKAETVTALATDATIKAKAVAERAESDIEEIRQDIAATQQQLATYAKTLEEIEKRAETVKVSFKNIQIRVAEVDASATTLTRRSIDTLLDRVKVVESTISDLAEKLNYVTPSGDSVATVQAKVASESELRLKDIEERSVFTIYMWISHLDEAKQLIILEKLSELGFAIPYKGLQDIRSEFKGLQWEPRHDIDSIESGTFIVRINESATDNIIAYAKEVQQVLSSLTDRKVLLFKTKSTSSSGAVVTVKP